MGMSLTDAEYDVVVAIRHTTRHVVGRNKETTYSMFCKQLPQEGTQTGISSKVDSTTTSREMENSKWSRKWNMEKNKVRGYHAPLKKRLLSIPLHFLSFFLSVSLALACALLPYIANQKLLFLSVCLACIVFAVLSCLVLPCLYCLAL
jgi:hypothetical protein